MIKVIVYDIKWDVSDEELTQKEQKDILKNLPTEVMFEIGTQELEKYEISPAAMDEEIINNEHLLDDIADILSDTYGFCHDGFQIVVVRECL